jgi:hypothetical protein
LATSRFTLADITDSVKPLTKLVPSGRVCLEVTEMKRSAGLEKFIDEFRRNTLGWDGDEEHCVICNGPRGTFRDDLSAREWGISKTCQRCQDDVFGGYE